jgi:hypothetical protein
MANRVRVENGCVNFKCEICANHGEIFRTAQISKLEVRFHGPYFSIHRSRYRSNLACSSCFVDSYRQDRVGSSLFCVCLVDELTGKPLSRLDVLCGLIN